MMTLTFTKENKFVLSGFQYLPGYDWTRVSDLCTRTSNIKEAARFRQYADSKAENIFKKLMLKRYPAPAGGLIMPDRTSLLPFQKDLGVPFILSRSKSYLAHQPGLGKTVQCVCAVNTSPGKALVIVPSFLKTTWAREITKWAEPGFPTIAIVPDSPNKNKMNWAADYILVSDAMLIKAWVIEALSKLAFKFVFIDEAHRFKNPVASRSVALFGGALRNKKRLKGPAQYFKSPGLIYNSKHVVALSGTPMLNKPIELWTLLYAMAPETIDFMSYQTFGFRYCGAFQDDRGHYHFTGSNNEAELNKKIMGTFMQRITKSEVLKDLPDKVREIVVMDHDPRNVETMALDQALSSRLENSSFEVPDSLGEYAVLRHQNGLAKVQFTFNMVADILRHDETEAILLYAHHRDVVQALHHALTWYRPGVIQGGLGPQVRTEIEDAFQKGDCRLIIGNIDAMNLGLTLTKATRVIFCEYAWTPALNEQAEDRAHRIGKGTDSVFVQYVVLPNSIDEKILTAVLKKENAISKVIEGK